MEQAWLERTAVTAAQMRQIEERLFAAGMPVAALMEKVGLAIAQQLVDEYPRHRFPHVGIVVGPGHNGGDALVVARELHLRGYQISLCRPIAKLKDLTAQHADYASHLGLPVYDGIQALAPCALAIDGLFGFGLTRPLAGEIATAVDWLNAQPQPAVSIDIPSGVAADTGETLGTAVRAERTFCLGLWKRAFFQDRALAFTGEASRIDLGIPAADVRAILSEPPQVQAMSAAVAQQHLPLWRSPATHKYCQGHVLAVGGSERYAGGILLTGWGAAATGVGMLTLAVPSALKLMAVSQLPDALVAACPETETGAIAQLPPQASEASRYSAIACGPGLTTEASATVQALLPLDRPLVLDADALNCLAAMGAAEALKQRPTETVLTPHPGEFRRLFPQLPDPGGDRLEAVQAAARHSGAIILLKGARTAIAHPDGGVWVLPESTPALARGGSGDVLTGLIGGLLAQPLDSPAEAIAAAGAWWHAQAGLMAARQRTQMGVDARTLSQFLIPALQPLTGANDPGKRQAAAPAF